jgi:hypothetical protein
MFCLEVFLIALLFPLFQVFEVILSFLFHIDGSFWKIFESSFFGVPWGPFSD